MAKLDILHYPDPRLRTVASPVEAVDERVVRLIDDMFETMYAAPGIGLAATQVDVHERIIVMDVSEDRSRPLAFVNPRITTRDGETVSDEGCLSVPEYFEAVRRAEHVTVEATGRDGEPFTLEAEGLLAVCIQHEMDHLEGRLFVDYLSDLKRKRLRRRLEKQARQRGEPAGQAAREAG
ncbi:Peptide deformylase [wastewater metagenome]|uniref:Peptide deformylase n=2 Tax=unclassified sequences TaxID=12908 RepID=A0A5B8R5Y5_9ZZZZ|nr:MULTISPECIES: peptide deformylase [Arhodomonas]MCS4505099.1 peptide deformylase [Arhodomonas aquaeolei]QEA04000.1 peptide deformylase [uncultured organism]